MRVAWTRARWRRSLTRLGVWLAVVGGLASVAGTEWPPARPPPTAAATPAAVAQPATQPASAPEVPAPRTPLVDIRAATKGDRRIVQRAAALLRRHRELADQRRAEIKRHLTRIGLFVDACDVCKEVRLTSGIGDSTKVDGDLVCDAVLNMPFIKKEARQAQVPVEVLAAMALLHDQELCLHEVDGKVFSFGAEQRLAAKLHDPRLFDLAYAQVDVGGRDWWTVEQAVGILRDHGELAAQRYGEIRRRRFNQVGPLLIKVCRSCRTDLVGESSTDATAVDAVGCEILLDLSGIEGDARAWGLPVSQLTASVLVHEQEHCVRDPDDRETPAIDEERRLAQKLGSARLLEYVTSFYSELDSSGHWKG